MATPSPSLLERLKKKLGITPKKRDPKNVKLGSGLANNAKLAITSRQAQIDKQSGF